jgi:MSHA pilin protein MshC
VIVLVLVGIISATMGPRFFSRDTFQELGFYDEVLSAARYGQKLAINSGCQVQFNIAANSYALKRRVACDTASAFTPDVLNPANQTAFSGSAPSGVTPFAMTAGAVVFDAQGRATDLTDRTVTVGSRTFQIIGASGFVQAP